MFFHISGTGRLFYVAVELRETFTNNNTENIIWREMIQIERAYLSQILKTEELS